MKTHPKKFSVYIIPFLLVIPLTIISFVVVKSVNQSAQQQLLASIKVELRTKLDADLQSLQTQIDAIASATTLQNSLLAGDTEASLAILAAEGQNRDIQYLEAINESDLNQSPAGQTLLQGAPSVSSIEINPITEQVTLISIRWVDSGNHSLGALQANQDLDNAYAKQLASLQPLANRPPLELGFYINSLGLTSSSFNTDTTHQTVLGYLNPNRINALNTTSTITLNGHDYKLDKTPLDSLESTNTGLLIFLPVMNQLKLTLWIFGLSLLAAFLTDLILSRRHS